MIAFDRGDLERYRDATDPLLKTLTALLATDPRAPRDAIARARQLQRDWALR